MELTKQRMWVISRDGFEYHPTSVMVDKIGTLRFYEDEDGDLFHIEPEEVGRYFLTEESAMAALSRNTPSNEQILNVLSYIRRLKYNDDKRNDEVESLLKERFNSSYAEYVMKGDREASTDEYDIPSRFGRVIRVYLANGYINIDARTFRKEDVACVMWGDNSADACESSEEFGLRLKLKDGSDVDCHDWIDRWLVMAIFGGNETDREFAHITANKEEK